MIEQWMSPEEIVSEVEVLRLAIEHVLYMREGYEVAGSPQSPAQKSYDEMALERIKKLQQSVGASVMRLAIHGVDVAQILHDAIKESE